jgi:glutamate carboxypeptidase
LTDWIGDSAREIARRAEPELAALVGVSSPSGDSDGAEACLRLAGQLVPPGARVERIPCSSPDHAQDLVARLPGTGQRRLLLLGHVDTVVAHAEHRPLERDGDRLLGSGTVDMKGGVVLALGVLRALAQRRADFAEATLLLVCDEEWRTTPFAHVERFAAWDVCLCFEAGERTADGGEGVVVRRKAAGTVRITGHGRTAHSGSAPDRGRNALLALAAAAQAIAARHDPSGPDHLTAVPTVLNTGAAFNVVPGTGTLFCDVRADGLDAVKRVVAAVPGEVGGAILETAMVRLWPGMDAGVAAGGLIERASAALGRPVVGVARGGASDASHFAAAIPVTVDGLGPRGGLAHNPGEYVLAEALHSRAEVALAVTDAAL